MREFLTQNWSMILAIIIVASFLATSTWKYIILIKEKKWQELRAEAYRLMLKAERAITGTKMGRQRFEQVFTQIYSLIPPWLRLFIPESTVREKLQHWYIHIKDYMDNGELDGSAKSINATIL